MLLWHPLFFCWPCEGWWTVLPPSPTPPACLLLRDGSAEFPDCREASLGDSREGVRAEEKPGAINNMEVYNRWGAIQVARVGLWAR